MKDAVAVILRKIIPKQILRGIEQGYRCSRAFLVNVRYGFPARGLRIIGVTGTNGKTTTSNYVNEMLKSQGYKTAMFTTAVIDMAGKQKINELNRTVPLTAELFAFFKEAKRKKVDWVIMEVTAHALDQHKMDWVPFEVAAITNLTQDHLDYFGTMERYAEAKAALLRKRPRVIVLNTDDKWYNFFKSRTNGAQVLTFGRKKSASLKIENLTTSVNGSEFTILENASVRQQVKTPLLGEFNAYNAAAAYGIGMALQLSSKHIAKGIAALKAVPGRMERIDEGQPFTVLVDYAHTADALREVLLSLKKLGAKRTSIVFGATGDRDTAKRPHMGIAVGEQANRIYLTDDEPYSENPDTIRAEVMAGIKKVKAESRTQEFDDRLLAIQVAFKEAKPGDVVVITGMGHERFRMIKGKKQPWDERAIVRKLLTTLVK